MGYQPSGGRVSGGRPRGFDRPKKSKAKKTEAHRSAGTRYTEYGLQTLQDVSDRTLAGLDNLGAQSFATPPFSQHFDRWMKSLITVLDDFEASPAVKTDDVFHGARGELLSAVDAALRSEQEKETRRGATILGLHGSKDALLSAEREHDAKMREHSARRDRGLKVLTEAIEPFHAELEEVRASKAGLFEGFTKSKAKREEEAAARLATAENELETAKASFAVEQADLQSAYDDERRVILERVAAEKREIERLDAEAEVDGSVEVRRVACEELAAAVKALVRRAQPAEKVGSG